MFNFKSTTFKMVATTQQYLEPVLSKELESIGAKDIETYNRAVSFSGDLSVMYSANIQLRTALKILVPITSFHIRSEHDLYKKIKEMAWEEVLDVDGTLAISVVLNSKLFNHSQFLAQKTKDAIVDRFREKFGRRPSVDLTEPHLSVMLHIVNDEVKVSLDSSGISLHRRGYKKEQTIAPINEVTAAGMILLSGWDGKSTFIDPMCGSGTLVIEAALIASQISPGLFRSYFGCKHWPSFNKESWQQAIEKAKQLVIEPACKLIGSDKTFKAIEIARQNAVRAGVDEFVVFSNKRFEEVKPPASSEGTVMINPPYGERLPIEEISIFYKQMGDKLKQDFQGYAAWIISSNAEAMKRVGLAASTKLNLFNGPLLCKFHKFELYKGSKRAPKQV
ncbi:MAG: THUMP domain-containing protein [Bacteroidia bacterium]|jgi:putative N6-adenine-specific DNA methylase|nr:THUMP domain-containing protein [Bacteroidia bacterium]